MGLRASRSMNRDKEGVSYELCRKSRESWLVIGQTAMCSMESVESHARQNRQ